MTETIALTEQNIREVLKSKSLEVKQPSYMDGWNTYTFWKDGKRLVGNQIDQTIREDLGLEKWDDLIELTDKAGITINI